MRGRSMQFLFSNVIGKICDPFCVIASKLSSILFVGVTTSICNSSDTKHIIYFESHLD